MWFLQRRNMHKQSLIVLNLGLLISIAHIGLLLCLFFVYQDSVQHLDLAIMAAKNYREIEFRVAVEKMAPRKATGATVQKPFDKLRANGGKVAAAAPVKKIPVKSTSIAAPEKKGASKETDAKKAVVAKTSAAKASPALVTKKIEEKIVEKVEVPVAKAVEQAPAAQPLDKLRANGEGINLALSKEGEIDSSLAYFQAEYKALYENLSEQWAPPAGIPATSTCVITVVLDREGQVDDMLVDNSSGMLVFDLAARSALSEVEFPRFVWGKSITVTFSV